MTNGERDRMYYVAKSKQTFISAYLSVGHSGFGLFVPVSGHQNWTPLMVLVLNGSKLRQQVQHVLGRLTPEEWRLLEQDNNKHGDASTLHCHTKTK